MLFCIDLHKYMHCKQSLCVYCGIRTESLNILVLAVSCSLGTVKAYHLLLHVTRFNTKAVNFYHTATVLLNSSQSLVSVMEAKYNLIAVRTVCF